MTVSNSAAGLIFISSILTHTHTPTHTHRCLCILAYTHKHTHTDTHKHKLSSICSVPGVDFVTAVQNGVIEITVIVGHVTAPSGRCVFESMCVRYVCYTSISVRTSLCLVRKQLKSVNHHFFKALFAGF